MFFSYVNLVLQNPLNILPLIIVSLTSCGVALLIYRLNFHPLAKYPGPLLGRLTDLYSVYHAWTGRRHLNLYRLHQKHGDIVRYGPNSISINTNTALQTIYSFKANVRKANFYSVFPATKGSWSTHSAIDKNLHARKRRVLSQAFSDSAMRGLQPHILQVIETFCCAIGGYPPGTDLEKEKKHDGWSKPRDMASWANYMSYDVLGDICYGASFDTLTREDNRFAIKLVQTSSRFHYLTAQTPVLKKLGLDRLLFGDMRKQRQRFMAYSRARLAERMKLGVDNDRRDFFYYLLKARDPETGQGFGTQELWGESNVLLIAGSDTTSTALSSTLHHLLYSPTHLAALTSLIRSTFSNLPSITPNAVNQLPYLRACLDESMRLAPPVPALLPREVLAGGLDIDGHHFPAGTVVGVPTYALHHNEKYFPDAAAFRPERWLHEDGDAEGHGKSEDYVWEKKEGVAGSMTSTESLKLAQSAFCPFSIGPRGCIGKGVACAELGVAVARLLWLYDLRLVEEDGVKDGEYAITDLFVAGKRGPVVQYRLRL